MTITHKAEMQQYSRELATYTLHQFSLALSLYEQDNAPKSSLAHADNRNRGMKTSLGMYGPPSISHFETKDA